MNDVQIINLYFARDENVIAETKNKYENMCYSVAHNILLSKDFRDSAFHCGHGTGALFIPWIL